MRRGFLQRRLRRGAENDKKKIAPPVRSSPVSTAQSNASECTSEHGLSVSDETGFGGLFFRPSKISGSKFIAKFIDRYLHFANPRWEEVGRPESAGFSLKRQGSRGDSLNCVVYA